MSKKSKKKRKGSRRVYQEDLFNRKGKKSKKNKKRDRVPDYQRFTNYGGARDSGLKTVHATLTTKEAKANRNLIERPVKVEKEFLQRRKRCNHAGGLMTPQAFMNMTPSYSAFTPALDAMIAKFGIDNVSICSQCFDVVVNRDAVTSDDIRDAKLILYAASNIAVSNYRMKKKEVARINKKKLKMFSSYGDVCRIIDKVQAAKVVDTSSQNALNNLNQIQGSAFIS